MKVHLLYPDQDFTPVPLWAEQQADLTQDLGLDVLWSAMAEGDAVVREAVERVMLASLSVAPEVVAYRQAVLQDALQNPPALEALYKLVGEALLSEKKTRHWAFGRSPGSVLQRALELLGFLLERLHQLRAWAASAEGRFQSAAFRRLIASVQQDLPEDYLKQVQGYLQDLRFREGLRLGARLGPGNKGEDYRLLKTPTSTEPWYRRLLARKPPAFTFTLHPRDESGAQILRELQDRGLNTSANALAQSVDHILGFFAQLRTELAFYLGALNLNRKLQALGVPLCFPVVDPRPACAFEELGDIVLALRSGGPVVGNDLPMGAGLLVITGANQGGKTTFLRSLGQAQLMLQSGLFVGARTFTSGLCAGVFTHFKREEDTALKSGKFDEELSRMSRMVDYLRPGALVLFNESFASTNELEGAEVAYQVVRALRAQGVRVYLVSHMYSLTRRLLEEGFPDAMFLRAERKPDGSRSYRMLPGEPLSTSFGPDVYQQVFEPAPA